MFATVPIWKRLTLGTHKGVNALRAALDKAGVRIGDSADEILGRPAFAYGATAVDVDLVILSPRSLGFRRAQVPLSDVHVRATQLGFELCPAEVGPVLRLRYLEQPVGEFLRIAMRPVPTYEREPIDLTLANAGTGPILIGGRADPDLMLDAGTRLVFVRAPRIAQPHAQ